MYNICAKYMRRVRNSILTFIKHSVLSKSKRDHIETCNFDAQLIIRNKIQNAKTVCHIKLFVCWKRKKNCSGVFLRINIIYSKKIIILRLDYIVLNVTVCYTLRTYL